MDLYWLWLSSIKGVGIISQKKLLAAFGSPDTVYHATEESLLQCGLGRPRLEALLNARSLETAKKTQEALGRHNIKLVDCLNEYYPAAARAQPSSPAVLYYRGTLKNSSGGVAIVGSRRCTAYGKRVAQEAAAFLAENKITVLSGMAKGIDSYAHTACLKAGGYTLAFLANGLDICYPREHQSLMEAIIEQGAVISQYPPGTKPLPNNFPARNALMSAWSAKVLVVEAGSKSGSLITAKYAAEQQRPVLAVPSSIYETSGAGTNGLIAGGAQIYLSPDQLLLKPAAFNRQASGASAGLAQQKASSPSEVHAKLTYNEKLILEQLGEPRAVEELAGIVPGSMADLLELLCEMELSGKIEVSQGLVRARC